MSTEKIIDIDVVRATIRQNTRYEKSHCKHSRITVDSDAGTIDCDDCKKSLSAFQVVVSWAKQWGEIEKAVNRQKLRAQAMSKTMRTYRIRLRALRELEKFWWKGNMLPCCPHCKRGLMPDDFTEVPPLMVSREYELKRRSRCAEGKNGND